MSLISVSGLRIFMSFYFCVGRKIISESYFFIKSENIKKKNSVLGVRRFLMPEKNQDARTKQLIPHRLDLQDKYNVKVRSGHQVHNLLWILCSQPEWETMFTICTGC